jgi:hypothetical protein
MKPKQPFFFLKPPSSIVLPGEGPCLQPRGVKMHFEVELALIIGKMVRELKADDEQGALEAIRGKTTPLPSPLAPCTVHFSLVPCAFSTWLPCNDVANKRSVRRGD